MMNFRLILFFVMLFGSQCFSTNIDVAIIGAGLSGLISAYKLKNLWGSVQIFEASNRVGGRVLSVKTQFDINLPMGGTFINSDHFEMLALLKKFDVPIVGEKRNILPIDYQVIDGELSKSMDNFAEFASALKNLHTFQLNNSIDTLSALDLLKKILAPAKMHALISQSIRNEYGVELHEISAENMLTTIAYDIDQHTFSIDGNLGDEAFSMKGGSESFFTKLKNELEDQINFHHELVGISQEQDQFVLTFKNDNKTIKKMARFVIITLPLSVLRNITMHIKSISNEARAHIETSQLGRNQKLFLLFNQKLWQQKSYPHRFRVVWDKGFIWDNDDDLHGNNYFGLTVFLGGDAINFLKFDNGETLASSAVDLLEQIVPGIKSVYRGFIVGTSWQDNIYSRGSYSGATAPGMKIPPDDKKSCLGNLCFAGEAWASEKNIGYMEGAVESAIHAAKYIFERLH